MSSIRETFNLRSLSFDHAMDPMLWLDEKGKIIEINRALEETLGWKSEELQAKSFSVLDLKLGLNSLDFALNEVKRRGFLNYNTQYLKKSGDSGNCEFHLKYVNEESINLFLLEIRILPPTPDQSPSDMSEDENRKKFHQIFEYSHDAIFLLDPKNNLIVDVNSAATRMLGYSRSQLVGMRISDIHPHQMDDFRDLTENAFQYGGSWTDVLTCLTKSGEELPAEIAASSIDMDSERFLLCIVRNVSQRKNIEDRLEYRLKIEALISKTSSRFLNVKSGEIDRQIHHTLEKAGTLVGSDRSYVYLYKDKEYVNTHEWVAEGVEPMMDIQNTENSSNFKWIHNRLRENKTVLIPDLSTLPEDQSQLRKRLEEQGIKSTLAVPISSAGKLKGFLGFDGIRDKMYWRQEDINLLKVIGEVFSNALERSHYEDNLKKVNNELAELNDHLEKIVEERTAKLTESNEKLRNAIDELDHFVYRAAHDLKGPIKRLLGLCQIAEIDIEDLKSREYNQLFRNVAQGMDRGLSKLLEVNQVAKTEPSFFDMSLREIVLKSVRTVQKEVSSKSVIDVLTNEDLTIRSCPYFLPIILHNLLENAIIFSQHTSRDPYIEVEFGSATNHYFIRIKDNGLGILPDSIDLIYDMFYRGSNDSEGTGLGLYLVKQSVEKLNGSIEVSSVINQYTEFRVKLPLR